jgi:voltage-gated potassium channel
MRDESRLERRLDRWVARAVTPRGAAVVIASVTTAITVAAGLLMTVIDREDYPTLGSGIWWAVQTVTTVGYGDLVPQNTAGRLVATLVMLLGIGFVTVITAYITSSFVARQGRSSAGDDAGARERLASIDERLARIEAALEERR